MNKFYLRLIYLIVFSIVSTLFMFGTTYAGSMTLKMGTVVNDSHPNTIAMVRFGQLVGQRTSGEIIIKVFPSSQLGGEKEMAEGIRLGSVQGAIINVSVLGGWVPEGQIFDMPFIFRNVRFYGICVHDINNYKRPNNFFRKYLYKSVINDRGAIYKRPSTTALQNKLIGNLYKKKYQINFDYKNINENLSNLKNYIYFHLKQQRFDKLGWSTNELNSLFGEFLKYKKQVIFTRDIETNNRNMDFYKIFLSF